MLGSQQREVEPRTFRPTLIPRSRSTRQQYENKLEEGSIGKRANPESPPPHQCASISLRPSRCADRGRRREVRGCARARGGLGPGHGKAGRAGLQPPRSAPLIGALRLSLHGYYLCHVRRSETGSRCAAERGAVRGGGDLCRRTQSSGTEDRIQGWGRPRSPRHCGAGAAPPAPLSPRAPRGPRSAVRVPPARHPPTGLGGQVEIYTAHNDREKITAQRGTERPRGGMRVPHSHAAMPGSEIRDNG
ncbi:uncharacterized protein LOC110401847 [Numida meleagris]|uniref:uncharacterized protein LOC110401847 n=1 Tax=Numida meleagris TaxID=8996 RepID=UPI000B3E2AFD|nr:uncharacterized protein LOC110401847 [Numida meleagris]